MPSQPEVIAQTDFEGNNPLDRESTICAMVIDLTARDTHIAWGNPCQNAYHTYHLSE